MARSLRLKPRRDPPAAGCGGTPGWWPFTSLPLEAAAFVSFVSVDLGPALRSRAEEAASTQIERPVHMGKLSIHLLTGRFVVEDVVIEGLAPDDRPFLTCERIFVSISWRALLGGEFLIDSVDMADFEMLVESFPAAATASPTLPAHPPPTLCRRTRKAGDS